jgi:hypothetical protein
LFARSSVKLGGFNSATARGDLVRRQTTFIAPYIIDAIIANRDRPKSKKTYNQPAMKAQTPAVPHALTHLSAVALAKAEAARRRQPATLGSRFPDFNEAL